MPESVKRFTIKKSIINALEIANDHNNPSIYTK